MMIRKYDIISEEQRRQAIETIMHHFATERDEKLGVIATEEMLDFFLREIGVLVYNHALEDVKPFLEKKLEEGLIDLDVTLRKEERKTGQEK